MNGFTMRPREKSKDTLKQKKMRTLQPKIGHKASTPKMEIHSISGFSQKNKQNHKQSIFTLKDT